MINCSHEFHVFSKSGLSSGIVVINLVHVHLHVDFISRFTSLVHSVWDFVWVVFLEFLGVEVVTGLDENLINIFVEWALHGVWNFVWVFILVLLGQEQVVHLEEKRIGVWFG